MESLWPGHRIKIKALQLLRVAINFPSKDTWKVPLWKSQILMQRHWKYAIKHTFEESSTCAHGDLNPITNTNRGLNTVSQSDRWETCSITICIHSHCRSCYSSWTHPSCTQSLHWAKNPKSLLSVTIQLIQQIKYLLFFPKSNWFPWSFLSCLSQDFWVF